VQAQTIKVFLNGALINSFTSTDPARDLTQGFIGIQNHGNGDDVSFRNIQIKEIPDNAAPVTTATFASPGPTGWHPGTVPVQLAATDEGQGVDRIEYKLDSGAWTTYTGTVTVTGDGNHTLLYRAVDKAGNTEAEKAATIKDRKSVV
jgi:cytochrome c